MSWCSDRWLVRLSVVAEVAVADEGRMGSMEGYRLALRVSVGGERLLVTSLHRIGASCQLCGALTAREENEQHREKFSEYCLPPSMERQRCKL